MALGALVLAGPGLGAPTPTHWCGTETAVDQPDTSDNAFLVHVVYAYPADGPDQFGARILPIVADLAAGDSWWRQQDPTRTIRFDFASFPGCDTQFGQLDVSSVRLPQAGSAYANPDTIVQSLSAALDAAGFLNLDKKYVVYWDGPVTQPGGGSYVCGKSPLAMNNGDTYSIVVLQSPCGDGLGSALSPAATAIHELIHNLGALPPGAPHACRGDSGHPCDSPADIMYPSGYFGTPLSSYVLDVGRDDYYGHGGSWWDVRTSPWLLHLDQALASPTAPGAPSATSAGTSATVSWQASTSPNGPVDYRVFKNGVLAQRTSGTSYSDFLDVGTTATYAVQAVDLAGQLSSIASVRFTGGLGVVDANGALVKDTVPPDTPATLKARKVTTVRRQGKKRITTTTVVLTWAASHDGVAIAGYQLSRDGRAVGGVTTSLSAAFPLAAAKGTWTVVALDTAGNRSAAGPSVKVS